MKIHSLGDLWLHQILDLHSAETQILKSMPRMADAATHLDLKRALEKHQQETSAHLERLDSVLEMLEAKANGAKCAGMEGLLAEAKALLGLATDPAIRDAGLVAEVHKIEHYEVSAYGSAVAFADLLGETQAADLLRKTLREEVEADRALTRMAETHIYPYAAAEPAR